MKKCKFLTLAILLCGNLISTSIFAANLMDVYKHAVVSDPGIKAANAKWLADREILNINKADLLPSLSAGGSFYRNRTETDSDLSTSPGGYSRNYNNTAGYSLKLSQPIFNFSSWAGVWLAQATAKQAGATFMEAQEDLLSRTSQAYLDVLLAKDVLSYSKSNKNSVERMYIQAKHKFDVGLTAITDLENARKNFDIAVSQEIAAINELDNKCEKLTEITGVRYSGFAGGKKGFPLLSPKPSDINQWVKAAEQQNYKLAAARYATLAARENIKVQNAGHLPTVTAGVNYDYSTNNNANGESDFYRQKTGKAGVELNLPIFQGGKVSALAKRADYEYQQKLAAQEQMHRTIVSETRQTYLGIISNISKIKADLQTIKSAESSLRATQASYSVGTQTMFDVLDAQTKLYDAQKTFAQDEYKYIMQLLNLKALTGTLAVSDLAEINSWLEKPADVTKTKATPPSKATKKPHAPAAAKTPAAPVQNHSAVSAATQTPVPPTTSVTAQTTPAAVAPTTPAAPAVAPIAKTPEPSVPVTAQTPAVAAQPATTNAAPLAIATTPPASKIVVLDSEEIKQVEPINRNIETKTPSTPQAN